MAGQSDNHVVIFGAGRVGLCMAEMLADAGKYRVTLADCTEEALAAAAGLGLRAEHVDVSRPDQVRRLLADACVAVAATPDRLVHRVAQAAAEAGVHYLDFCEADEETRAAGSTMPADRAFLPGCGVSPGLVDSIACGLVARLDEGCDLDVRVGAIPARRTNRLGYSLIWNLDGLMTEYTRSCAAIVDGMPATLPALSDRVEFEMDGVGYEAFLTAGSVGALVELVAPRVRNLVFRTIRYPGHLDYMQLLLDDLGLRTRRDLLMTVLRNGLPAGEPDALIIDVRASGTRAGRPAEEAFSRRFEPRAVAGGHSVLALASAAHAASLIDLLRNGGLRGPCLRTAALVPHEVLESSFFMRALGQAPSNPAPQS